MQQQPVHRQRTQRQVGYQWHLRLVMAEHGIYATTDLVPLLHQRGVDLSVSQVHRMVTGTPERLSLTVLAALCDILQVSPSDLITTSAADASTRQAAPGTTRASRSTARSTTRSSGRSGAGPVEDPASTEPPLRPVRARLDPPPRT